MPCTYQQQKEGNHVQTAEKGSHTVSGSIKEHLTTSHTQLAEATETLPGAAGSSNRKIHRRRQQIKLNQIHGQAEKKQCHRVTETAAWQ
jgi:hypothetical protein